MAPFEMLCNKLGWDYGIAGAIAVGGIIIVSLLLEWLINKKQ